MNTAITLVLTLLLCGAQSARILGIFPVPSTSHYILGNKFLKGLAAKGHDVTMISPYQERYLPKNGSYRDVQLDGFVEEFEARRKDINFFEKAESNVFLNLAFIYTMTLKRVEGVLNHTNVQALIKSGEKFDAVIVEQFLNDGHKALSAHFGGPLISFCTTGTTNWINPLVGNPSPIAYIPEVMMQFSEKPTFFERLQNTFLYLFSLLFHQIVIYPANNRIIKKYLPGQPELDDVLYNSSLVLLNTHNSIGQPVPYVPNMIEIGGFHVQPSGNLPMDIQKFLDEAKDGVIYFSMGSNLHSKDLPKEKLNALVNAFGKLKQKVLWKFEASEIPNKPDNVKRASWLPQQDVLAHPNVKLFITHGGYLSTIETIYHGVPVLAIPIFGDQKLNAQTAVKNGYGRALPYAEISEHRLLEEIIEMLSNPVYGQNAKKRSKYFHDRPIQPMDLGVYWVEYVIRHGGTPHLRVGALDIPWYQYFLLDVIGFLILVGLVTLYINYMVIRTIRRKFCGGKQHTQKQQKVKKN